MREPVITCPNCHSEIKLTEPLAAPLIEAARKRHEERFAEKDAAAKKAEPDLTRKERELDDARRDIELTVEKQLQSSLLAVGETTKREAQERLKLKTREKEQQIAPMQRRIALRRNAEQESQQLQGEVQELELERQPCERGSLSWHLGSAKCQG
jgi:hypothetical protein